jgi:hypothetical protein
MRDKHSFRWPPGASVAALVLLFTMMPLCAWAQITQFLPEIDTYVGLNDRTQFWFQAKETREDAAPTQAEIGPSLDIFLKPLVKLNDATIFDLDPSKRRLFVLSVGYRYLPSSDNPTTNRILLMGTGNLPLTGRLLLSDRNRLEVNFEGNESYWRYRNRLFLQRTFRVRSCHPSIYLGPEFYYNSRYDKWSTTALYGGAIFPLGSHLEINPYYEHQNSTGQRPNQQTNALGLILNIFLRDRN